MVVIKLCFRLQQISSQIFRMAQFYSYIRYVLVTCYSPYLDYHQATVKLRGELSYLAPLGSENISAPYFKQCFFQGGAVLPPRLSQTPRLPVPRQK